MGRSKLEKKIKEICFEVLIGDLSIVPGQKVGWIGVQKVWSSKEISDRIQI